MKGQSVMSYSLRPMRMEDISQVAGIERDAFPTIWAGTNYSKELKNPQVEYVVCVRNGVPAPEPHPEPRRGFLDVLRRRPPPPAPSEPPDMLVGFVGVWFMGGEGHIVSIAVREPFRRQGLGELLMLGAVEMALRRGQQVVTLEVRVSNSIAQSLYTKYGFSQAGIRKGYYSDNREDAFIMSTDTITSPQYQALLDSRRAEFVERYGNRERSYLGTPQ